MFLNTIYGFQAIRSLGILIVFSLMNFAVIPNVYSFSEDLENIIAQYWDFELRSSPIFASLVGDHRFDDKLDDYSPEEFQRQDIQRRSFLTKLQNLSPPAQGSSDWVNYKLLIWKLTQDITESKYPGRFMPVKSYGGPHTFFASLPKRLSFQSLDNYEDYMSRLEAFPKYMGQIIQLMQEGIKRGAVVPCDTLSGVDSTIQGYIVNDPLKSIFFKPFLNMPSIFSSQKITELKEKSSQIIMEKVLPEYANFLSFIKTVYLKGCRQSVGLSELMGGKEYYNVLIKKMTTLDMTAKEIHTLGLKEVLRIKQEMKELRASDEFEGTLQEYIQYLKNSSEYKVKRSVGLINQVSFIAKRIDSKIPKLFGKLPRITYGIRAIPDNIAPSRPAASYSAPSPDNMRAGFLNINTYKPETRFLCELEALTLHEAVPGHHLQIALQREIKNLPEFRKYMGFTAYMEGWALYAESLGGAIRPL